MPSALPQTPKCSDHGLSYETRLTAAQSIFTLPRWRIELYPEIEFCIDCEMYYLNVAG